jgi:hypothetical protein
MVTAYLPKGIRAVRAQQDKIAALKFSDFNLGDRKNYSMLAPVQILDQDEGEELKDNPPAVDDEPRAVHPAKCNENPTLRKAPGSERLCQAITFMLPWWLLMARPSYYSRSNVDP